MTSSMSTGEKRWASARRGGMTVLGKVAVPKPINLPSQRLENHGLDPSVDIVPKGTVTWGGKSSPSATNVWGSSTSNPSADSGAGSPSHLSGRPSSSGNGTRPSTAGSDRSSNPIANAWGPNSRPSSASGALTTNQTSLTSLRPHSAETRPGSSQLSRFSETLSEHSVAWVEAGTAGKLGVKFSKNDGFSLSSGDFPTLGYSSGNNESKGSVDDHPSSSFGRPSLEKELAETSEIGDVPSNANVMSGPVDSWRRDNSQYIQDGIKSSLEKYQGEPQLYAGVHPQHLEPWHGRPVNNSPGSVWYRGPPYGAPVGGFPMEPFPYYRPQIPGAALTNPHPVPPQGSGPRGHHPNHPKNIEMYRPHMSDAYIRPGMSMRPGFYHGPVAYDGYYDRSMGYCNSNVPDIQFLGRGAGLAVYNRYPAPNPPDPGKAYGSSGNVVPLEQVESGHPRDRHGPYKVILKPHNELDGKDVQEKLEDIVTTDGSYHEKSQQLSSWENNWVADPKQNEAGVVGEESSHQAGENRRSHDASPVKVKACENVGNKMAVDDNSVKKMENSPVAFPEVSGIVTAASKDSSLIQKIEGLNAKARASDGRLEVKMRKDKSHAKVKVNHSNNWESGSDSMYPERNNGRRILNAASPEGGVTAGDKSISTTDTGAIMSRRSHGIQSRADHRGRGRFNTQEFDGRWRRPLATDTLCMESAVKFEGSSNIHIQRFQTSANAVEKSGSYPQRNDGEESVSVEPDPSNLQTQMRELTQQRAKQLQEEEDERISKQKESALAKLEDLDRHTRAEGSFEKSENVHSIASQAKQKIFPGSNPCLRAQVSESSSIKTERSIVPSNAPPLLETPKNSYKEYDVVHKHYVTMPPAPSHPVAPQQDVNNAEAAECNTTSHFSDGKLAGYKQKQNIPSEKNATENVVPSSTAKAPKDSDITVRAIDCVEFVGKKSAFCNDSSANAAEFLVHQKRKSSSNAKNNKKGAEASPVVSLTPSTISETSVTRSSVESVEVNVSDYKMDPSSVQPLADSKDASHSSDRGSSIPYEEPDGRVNNTSKSQHSHRGPRNPQINRMAGRFRSNDTVVWAPVRPQNKNVAADEASEVLDGMKQSVKTDVVQSSVKNKRAEIERYIPKPVAKEMGHQGSIQQPVAPVKQTMPDEIIGSADSVQGTDTTQPAGSNIGKVGISMELRNGDSRRHKQGKAHGSWRQRGLSEPISSQLLQDGSSLNSNLSRKIHASTAQQGTWNDVTDGWGMDNPEPTIPITVPVVKHREVPGRGKYHSFRGHRGTGQHHDFDHKKISSGETKEICTPSSVPEQFIQTDLTANSKQNHVGEHTSHWQPKTRAFTAFDQRGSRPNSGQNIIAEVGMDKSAPQADVTLPSQATKTSEDMAEPHHGQSIIGKGDVEEVPNVGNQGAKRERRMLAVKGHHQSPNQGPANSAEQAPASKSTQHDQWSSYGNRRKGNQNSHFGRGHESQGVWSSTEQDTKQNNPPANQERQRPSSDEFQKVSSHNSNKLSSIGGSNDGSHNGGPRFSEKRQSQPRRGRGNFSARETGTSRVDAAYN